jgi:AraC-like DNA-binding protein
LKNNATVSADIIYSLNEYSVNRRIDINKIYHDTGFNFENIINNNLRISANKFHALWEIIFNESGDNNFGLHVAQTSNNDQKKTDILYSILSNSSSIEHAVRNLIRYHDMTSDLIKIHLDVKNNIAVLSWNSFTFIEQDRQYSESIMAKLAFLLFKLSENRVKIKEISFIHDKPVNIDEHIQIFNCSMHFGKKRNEIIFNKNYLSFPIEYPNKELLALFEKYASDLLNKLNLNNSFAEKVYHLINKILSKGEPPSIKKVASELTLSVRNLQYKLKEENTSFKNILDELRKEIAVQYLKKPDTVIYELAFILGFSEQSSFNHAFKKWTGISPREYKLKNK